MDCTAPDTSTTLTGTCHRLPKWQTHIAANALGDLTI
jgi:hypothetical protein